MNPRITPLEPPPLAAAAAEEEEATRSPVSLRALLEQIPRGRLSESERKRRTREEEDAENLRIDLGLAISGATLRRGQCRSLSEIAAYCDCSYQFIHMTEQRALDKMRQILLPMILRGELDWP